MNDNVGHMLAGVVFGGLAAGLGVPAILALLFVVVVDWKTRPRR